MENIKHEVMVQNWINNIQERLSSGLSVKNWCLRNNIPESQYYYWLKVVRRESLQQTGGQLSVQTNAFVEIAARDRLPDMNGTSPAAILRRGNLSVELYEQASAAFIQKLVGSILHA